MDALSAVLRLSRPRGYAVGATDVGGDVAIAFPAHAGVYVYCVARGECLLQVDSEPAVHRLGVGDCVVLSSGRPFVLASDLDLPRTDAAQVFEGRPNGSIGTWKGGGGCLMFAAHFEFDPGFTRFMFDCLEPVVRIHDEQAQLSQREAIEQMIAELQSAQPGHEVVVEHLVHIALVKLLRFHLGEEGPRRTGWLYALADRSLGLAIGAMQRDPSHPWTVASLGRVAAMSRTAFAVRFKAATGFGPLDFVTRLRMLVAARKLREPGMRIATVAREVGYDSESAFSMAFKRVMGAAPRHYVSAE